MRTLKLSIAIIALLSPACALAQSSPNLRQGQVPTPAQWNSYFAAKQDVLGYTAMNAAGGSFTGRIVTVAPANTAGFNLTPGSAPVAPVNGDVWVTSSGIFARVNGVTVDMTAACSGCALTNAANVFTASPQTAQGLTTTSPGWYAQLSGDSTPRIRVGLNSTDVPSIAFGSGSGARDTSIERVGAGSLRFGGPDSASPVAQTLGVQNATGTNVAGQALTINGSRGTGTGAGGIILIQITPPGVSGSSQNPYQLAMAIASTGVVINANTTPPGSPVAPLVPRPLRIISSDGNPVEVVMQSFGDDSVLGAFVADGTAAAPVALANDKVILHLRSLSWDGVEYGNTQSGVPGISNASIASWAAQAQSPGHHGSYWSFEVTPKDTTSRIQACRLTSPGGFACGLSADTPLGVFNALTGYQVNSAATSGHVLRGNGTNFVDAALACSDLSGVGAGCAAGTMTATVGGLVPTPPNNTTTFLRGDATFAAVGASSLSGTTLASGVTGSSLTSVGTLASIVITGGTVAGLTGLAVRDTSAAFDVTLAATSSTTLTAGRTLTLDVGNVAHTLKFGTTANTITFPNLASFTVITNGDTGTVTNAMLANSTISGVSLGGTLGTLTFGTHLTTGGSSYNGSAGVTITSDATSANTASTIVARDGSGNFTAGTVTAALSGNATTATSATSATSATNSTNAAITDDTSTNATMNLTWVTTNTGNLPIKTSSTKLNFNPSTGLLASTQFLADNATAGGVVFKNAGGTADAAFFEGPGGGLTFKMGTANIWALLTNALGLVIDYNSTNASGVTFTPTGLYAPNLPTTTAALAAALCWTATTGQFQRDTNASGCLVSNAASKHGFERLDSRRAYETVMAAAPYSFIYNDNETIGRQIGFKADDFVDLDRRLVGFGANGEVQSFRYQQYTAEMTAAFQHRVGVEDRRYMELKADNDNLRAEIERLQKK